MSDAESAISIANDLFIVRCTLVATFSLFIYDYLCTLDDEVNLVWKSRISLVKCVFFVNRLNALTAAVMGVYLFLLVSNGEKCLSILIATSLINASIFVTGEIILFTRVYAVWGGTKYMAFFLATLYLVGAGGAMYASVRTTKTVTVGFMPELFGNGCLVAFHSNGFWICFFVLLCHETLMLLLIIIKAVSLNRHVMSRTVEMLMRDGILYYVCVLVLTAGNLLALFLGPPQLRGFTIILQGIVHSILCARLLLRLRGAYHSLTAEGMRSIRIQSREGQSASSLSSNENPQRGIHIELNSLSQSSSLWRTVDELRTANVSCRD